MSRMGAATVRILGDLSVDGVDVYAGLDRKARALLRLLARADGRPLSSASLSDALWGDRPPARPADQVAVLASRVRRLLGRDAVRHEDGGYRLVGVQTDLGMLRTLVDEVERRRSAGDVSGAVAAARVALTLAGGAPPEPDGDVDWVVADHAALVRLVQQARRVVARVMLDAGLWPDALDLAEADRVSDPYDEVAVRTVMRAEVAAGRPARALRAFEELRVTLADDLGADPDHRTRALHESLLRGELSPALRDVPVSPALVGRASQLAHLDGLADHVQGRPRVVVVTGEAGIGKSTLVNEWVRRRLVAGDTVLAGACGALDRSAPLDVVFAAVAEYVGAHRDGAAVLGEDEAVLAPLLGSDHPQRAARVIPDPVLGPAAVYAALTAVLGRIAGERGAVLVIDDAHLAGPALAEWLGFLLRRPPPLLVVAARRPGEGWSLPSTDVVHLGPLDLQDTAALVGTERAADLFARSGGHPLFLSEIAGAADGDLPASLVDAVVTRCDQLGDAAAVVRCGAVLGDSLDVDLLASLLSLTPLGVLDAIESATRRGLLVERDGRHVFRHELVREALATGTPASRATLLHREAARVLAARVDSNPVVVAAHARLGGDTALAAAALRLAADRAAARFDHATAADLLQESLALEPDEHTALTRARVLIRLERYAEAEQRATAASTSAEGSEVAAWAAYFDRRFDDAVRHADDGEQDAADDLAQVRCLMVGGRTRHAQGDLQGAQWRLEQATERATGIDRVTASAWLGVLLAHRSRPDLALPLLRPATDPDLPVNHTSAVLHALLFTGHAHALAGRPAEALASFARHSAEVERRHVPRFGGRGTNFGGWVLRNLGAVDEARDAHEEALSLVGPPGTSELHVAVLEDLVEDRLGREDPDAAVTLLAQVRSLLVGDLVFGWRLVLKQRLLQARLDLHVGHAEAALEGASSLARDATRIGVPRYASVAAVLVHRARAALGEPVDLDQITRDLARVERAVRIEAWWWTGETGAALRVPSMVARAERLADDLARDAGEHGDGLRSAARRRLEAWSVTAR